MILRPIIRGIFNRTNLNQSVLHSIIFDDSFSNNGNENKIAEAAYNILEQIPENGQLIWININGGIQYMGLKESISNVDLLMKQTYHSGSLSESLNSLELYANDTYTAKEVYILTDREELSLRDLWENADRFKDMNIYTIFSRENC